MSRPHVIWAEDDPDDRLLVERALRVGGIAFDLRFVGDGMELLGALREAGGAVDESFRRQVNLVVIDLNMPGMDGRKCLELKSRDPRLRRIPAIVMTTSGRQEDIDICYDLGASSYVRKPRTFDQLVDKLRELSRYWANVSELPVADTGSRAG
ncbi:MAG: response regulator [Pseudomonadota bacterium]|nr:response regulator [Pseudomonadota bacterium]